MWGERRDSEIKPAKRVLSRCGKRVIDRIVYKNEEAIPEYFLYIAEIVALRMNFQNGSMEPSKEPGIKALNKEAQNDDHVMIHNDNFQNTDTGKSSGGILL